MSDTLSGPKPFYLLSLIQCQVSCMHLPSHNNFEAKDRASGCVAATFKDTLRKVAEATEFLTRLLQRQDRARFKTVLDWVKLLLYLFKNRKKNSWIHCVFQILSSSWIAGFFGLPLYRDTPIGRPHYWLVLLWIITDIPYGTSSDRLNSIWRYNSMEAHWI